MSSGTDWPNELRGFFKQHGYNVDGTPVETTEEAKEELKEATKDYKDMKFSVPKMPAPNTFYVDANVWQSLCYCMAHNKNVLLLGPTGCGKTELALMAAKAFDRPAHTFNFGGTQEARLTLIGKTANRPKQGTVFIPSPFLNTISQAGAVHVWDELSRASIDAMNIVLPLLDRQAKITVDEQESGTEGDWVVEKSPHLAVVATANVGFEYVGAGKIDLALLNRFDMAIYLDFPPEDSEREVLVGRTKVAAKLAEKLVKAANQQRNEWKAESFSSAISTRQLLATAEAIKAGIPASSAVLFCIQSAYNNTGTDSEHEKVGQIFQRHLGY